MKTRTRKDDGKGGFIETIDEEQNSCTIKQSSKGQLSFEMKLYEDNPAEYKKEAFEYLKAIKEVQEEANRLGLVPKQ